MPTVRVVDLRSGAILAERAEWSGSLWQRFRGLMFRRSLDEGAALVLAPCNSIHMLFMRFPIDVLFLDRDNRATKLTHRLKPYRVAFGTRRTHSAIELPAGTLDRLEIQVGDELRLHAGT